MSFQTNQEKTLFNWKFIDMSLNLIKNMGTVLSSLLQTLMNPFGIKMMNP